MTQVWWSESVQSNLPGHRVPAPSGPACVAAPTLSGHAHPGHERAAQPPGDTTLPWRPVGSDSQVSSPGFQFLTGRDSLLIPDI